MSDAVARFLFDPPVPLQRDVFEEAAEPVRRFGPDLRTRSNWAGQRASTNIEDRRGEQPDILRDLLRSLRNEELNNQFWDKVDRLPPYTGMPTPWNR